MKKIILILLPLILSGCQTVPTNIEPVFASKIIEIKQEELSTYWVRKTTKIQMLNKRPTWLPKGKGEWTVLTVIDSNGNIVENTLISSVPEGFMTQSQVDAMPKLEYKPSITNGNSVPVKFYATAKVVPLAQL